MSAGVLLFGGEEGLFTRESPAIAGETPVLPDHAVAGHDHGNRIRGTGARHGADGFFASDGARDLAVGARRSPRNPSQFL